MHGAYYQEAMSMKSSKMQTISRCKMRTKLYGPANISAPASPYSAVNGNSRVLATNPSSVLRLH